MARKTSATRTCGGALSIVATLRIIENCMDRSTAIGGMAVLTGRERHSFKSSKARRVTMALATWTVTQLRSSACLACSLRNFVPGIDCPVVPN